MASNDNNKHITLLPQITATVAFNREEKCDVMNRIVMKELEELGLDLPQVDCVRTEGVGDARKVRESKRSPYM